MFRCLTAVLLGTMLSAFPPEGRAEADTRLQQAMSGVAIGANLPAIADYSRTPVYVDLLHQARRFGTPEAPWDEKALLGDNGWPTGDFGVFLMSGQRGVSGIAGRYTVQFTGQASVSVVASPARLGPPVYDAARNRTTMALDMPEGADQLALAFTRTGPGIRDLRVLRPGYTGDAPPLFTRAFLAHVRRFGALRFMDWLQTNHDQPARPWSQRPTPLNTRHASTAGVPWEHVIALANSTGKDIWINIPVRADDDYVLHLARLLKASLHPGIRVYVEYSNELWNAQFSQFAVNRELAIDDVRRHPDSPLAFDGSRNPDKWAFRRIAVRLKEISDIFRAVYGDAAMQTIIRPVFASQVVQPYVTELGLAAVAAAFGPPARYFYALAGAPYFNLGTQQTAPGLTAAQVLQAMQGSVTQLAETSHLEQNLALARWYGLPYLAYEGGSDTFGDGSLAAKHAASLDPQLESICRRYLDLWLAQGGGLFMWFTAGAGNWDTRFGTWELTTDLARADTPKIRCIDHVLAAPRPSLTARNRVPGRIDALAFAGAPSSPAAARQRIDYLHPGQFVDYLLRVPKRGHYRLSIEAEAASPGNALEVAADGLPWSPVVSMPARGWGHPAISQPVTLVLDQGLHTLRLRTRFEQGGFRLHTLIVEAVSPL